MWGGAEIQVTQGQLVQGPLFEHLGRAPAWHFPFLSLLSLSPSFSRSLYFFAICFNSLPSPPHSCLLVIPSRAILLESNFTQICPKVYSGIKSEQLEFLTIENKEWGRASLGVTGHRTQLLGKESQQEIGVVVLGSGDLKWSNCLRTGRVWKMKF